MLRRGGGACGFPCAAVVGNLAVDFRPQGKGSLPNLLPEPRALIDIG